MRTVWIVLKAFVFLFVIYSLILPLIEVGDTGTAFAFTVGGLWIVWGLKAPYRFLTRER